MIPSDTSDEGFLTNMRLSTLNLWSAFAVSCACALGLLACGGGKPPETPAGAEVTAPNADAAVGSSMEADGATAATADAGPSTGSSEGAPEPLAAVLVTDAAAVQKLFESASSAPHATLKPGGAAGGDALAKGVRDVAKKAAPGMKPEGPLATGSVKEKAHLQTVVMLQPGKCYAVVGFSSKVKDLDLYLLLAPGVLSGQDTTDDNTPVIGRAPNSMCPVAKTAIKYTLDIVADQGSGDVAVQLYSKDGADKEKKGK
jgi:hypothetical protein